MKQCPKCGKTLNDSMAFCTQCGTPLANAAAQPAHQPPQQPVWSASQPTQSAPRFAQQPTQQHYYAPANPVLNTVKQMATSPLFLAATAAQSGMVLFNIIASMAGTSGLLGKSESLRAARHFGTVLNKELSDSGAARPTDAQDAVAALSTMPGCAHRTAELCRQAGVRFDAVDHSTILARIIPVDAGSEQLAHAASVFAISARIAALESLQGMLRA